MLVFTIIMFAVAVLFGCLGINVGKGNIGLIDTYHRSKVVEGEKQDYCAAYSHALLFISGMLALSGFVNLFGSESQEIAAVAILVAGLGIGIVYIVRIQKRYNGGLF